MQADLDVLRDEVLLRAADSGRPIVDAMLALVERVDLHPLVRRVIVEGSPEDLQLVQSHALFAGTTRTVAQVLAHRQAAGTLSSAVSADTLALGMETIVFALVLSVVRAGMASTPGRVDAVIALLEAALGGPTTAEERGR